jgi:hypothetical protein
MLVYTEAVLILQYSYLTAAKCLCIGSSSSGSGGGSASEGDDGRASSSSCLWLLEGLMNKKHLDLLGLHAQAFRIIPLFVVYLATLLHHYLLAGYQPLSQEALQAR